MLSARNIAKHYGAVRALNNGTLEVNKGEVVALLGANGSGKSTLGKVMTGVVSPTRGEVLLEGLPVTFASPYAARKRGVTAVYQELSLIPDMTVAENIFWVTSRVGRRWCSAGGCVGRRRGCSSFSAAPSTFPRHPRIRPSPQRAANRRNPQGPEPRPARARPGRSHRQPRLEAGR